jgi:hypothetical protein
MYGYKYLGQEKTPAECIQEQCVKEDVSPKRNE